VAIITGASTGTGGHGQVFARGRARSLPPGARLSRRPATPARRAVGMRADVTREEDVSAMVDRAMKVRPGRHPAEQRRPGVDKYIWEQTLENWNATIAIDLTAACSAPGVLKRSMLERKTGSIVNFSSGRLERDTAQDHYCSAGAALRAFTKTVALVGPLASAATAWCRDRHRALAKLREAHGRRRGSITRPGGRKPAGVALRTISQPEDIGNLALFWPAMKRTITGQSINCDAGAVMVG
jgi:NAD(P)-dependent dehydrogenase (short-subunit alcohol dehydrogenase family)